MQLCHASQPKLVTKYPGWDLIARIGEYIGEYIGKEIATHTRFRRDIHTTYTRYIRDIATDRDITTDGVARLEVWCVSSAPPEL